MTFISEATTLEQFRQVEATGAALIERYRGTNTGIGGMIDRCEQENAEIVPLFAT